jgi:hypothetical protein
VSKQCRSEFAIPASIYLFRIMLLFYFVLSIEMEGEKKSESERELEKMDRSWSRAKSRDSSSPILCSIQFSESQRNISFL